MSYLFPKLQITGLHWFDPSPQREVKDINKHKNKNYKQKMLVSDHLKGIEWPGLTSLQLGKRGFKEKSTQEFHVIQEAKPDGAMLVVTFFFGEILLKMAWTRHVLVNIAPNAKVKPIHIIQARAWKREIYINVIQCCIECFMLLTPSFRGSLPSNATCARVVEGFIVWL